MNSTATNDNAFDFAANAKAFEARCRAAGIPPEIAIQHLRKGFTLEYAIRPRDNLSTTPMSSRFGYYPAVALLRLTAPETPPKVRVEAAGAASLADIVKAVDEAAALACRYAGCPGEYAGHWQQVSPTESRYVVRLPAKAAQVLATMHTGEAGWHEPVPPSDP